MIVIIDYGIGNLRSILNKLGRIGVDATISSNVDDIANATKLILPGVGAFPSAIDNLRQMHLIRVLEKKVLEDKVPILGICLGMQLMTKWSEEGNVEGLGWLDAETKSLRECSPSILVPHIGWNTALKKKDSPLMTNIPSESEFYFVHSFYVSCHDPSDIITVTNYGCEFASTIQRSNIFATQFHPEKSHSNGIKLLKNFAEIELC